MEYLPILTAFFGAAAGVLAPFLIPPLSNFLLARGLERYKLNLLRSQKAEIICQLLAYMPRLCFFGTVPKEDEIKINQLILESYLCLPFKLACELSETICTPEKRVNYKDFFIKVRKHILSAEAISYNDELEGKNIAHIILLDASLPYEHKSLPPQ